ncbi:phosphotransferase family enzyme [Thermosporothrix hazakensis]|jgi:hypothetical protein|uniref:Phosphotransferase family enzyme n=1 Tax=Thermosporothrix hazakensis TaxID=644383 RepID=A0A326TQE0_THEHA|nr:phosphotransferase [Thermosporothrix hazakensis]PZW18080.1 phosphotransferase family enzyme [Thermosporothrix hazakensis]GCE50683.1 hypothetical protein KTH_55520 [Thermosporothrix hazakensis]
MINDRLPICLPTEVNAFVSSEERSQLEAQLENYFRAYVVGEKYFIKVGTSEKDCFFQSLKREVKTYKMFHLSSIRCPKLVWHYIGDDIVVLVTEKIPGSPLADRREAFHLPPNVLVENLLPDIAKIRKVETPPHWVSSYHRDEKVQKYCKILHSHLPARLRTALESLVGHLHTQNNIGFSHGDLLPKNILFYHEHYWFIDWEWADLRPYSYDPALFALFSLDPLLGLTCFEKWSQFWNPIELYRDAVVIALREMKIWLTQATNKTERVKYAALWQRTLEEAIRWLM